ncbi:VOC family protein [Microbacterium sp. OR16]|uniref:VOC family protein n=1 Tax=Microbacterium sp. OR16 TaxID=3095345 RepID=UPI0039B3CD45
MPILNPYISFRDNAREALKRYRDVLAGELQIMTFGSMPDLPQDPSESELVLHGQLTTDDGVILMASDTPAHMEHQQPQGVSISITGDEVDRLRAIWDGLLDGGAATAPLGAAPWGGEFGMLVDRFGVAWMLSIDSGS